MKLEGNYNLGFYNPPSELNAARYSQQFSSDLALKFNNSEIGQETGSKQIIQTYPTVFLDPNMDLINRANNLDIENFAHLLQEGWHNIPLLPITPPLFPVPPTALTRQDIPPTPTDKELSPGESRIPVIIPALLPFSWPLGLEDSLL
jgi:hypothetical protein